MQRIRLFVVPGCGFVLAAVLALVALAADQRPSAKEAATAAKSAAPERQREGTRFEGSGRFEVTGDRAVFFPTDAEVSYRVLENLSLERVSRVLGENREPREWYVSGQFTEYQGINYLLLSKAVARLPGDK